jgi:hypothetical protein
MGEKKLVAGAGIEPATQAITPNCWFYWCFDLFEHQ